VLWFVNLNRESECIPRSLTSASSIRPEFMADGSRVAAGIFHWKLRPVPMDWVILFGWAPVSRLNAIPLWIETSCFINPCGLFCQTPQLTPVKRPLKNSFSLIYMNFLTLLRVCSLNHENSPQGPQTVNDLPPTVGTFASPRWVPQEVHDGRSHGFFKALVESIGYPASSALLC